MRRGKRMNLGHVGGEQGRDNRTQGRGRKPRETPGNKGGETRAILSGAPDLSKAFGLTYEFLLGAGGWIGYVVAALYYFGLDLGYAETLCTISQYGYVVIYYLNIAISFGQSA
jgi:hypothetical protein